MVIPQSIVDRLRPYQHDVVNRASARVVAGLRRGIIQGECGSGKTVCACYLIWRARERGKRVLVIADRRKLVKQFRAELARFGVDPGQIMSGESFDTRGQVVLACRGTLSAWKAAGKEIPHFDVIVLDECHRAMAQEAQAILALYPNAVVIGLSATPARDDGKSLGSFFQWIECMVPPSQLIAEGHLIRPEVFTPPELAKKRKGGAKVKGLAGDPVSHWKRHADGMPTIAFANSTAESLALADRFLKAGIRAEHIDSSVPDFADETGRSARDDFYDRLVNGQTKVLSNVGLLIEGVDLPPVGCVILWSKFGSLVKYRQSCGRGMRPSPGKSRCVILDHAGAWGQHGRPGDDLEWSLDLGTTVSERRKKAIEGSPDAKPVACAACGFVFAGSRTCPTCGWVIPMARPKSGQAKAVEAAADEILKRAEGHVSEAGHQALHREWVRAIYIAIARGGSAGMAASIFRGRTKLAPWQAHVSPMPADRDGWRQPAAQVFPDYAKVKV